MLPRKKLIVCGSAVVGGVWWVALLSCETLCVWVHPGLARANLAAPTKQSSPVRLKEVCSFDKKDGEAPERFLSVVFAPDDGQRVYTTSFAENQMKVFLRAWDLAKRQVLWERTVAERTNLPEHIARSTGDVLPLTMYRLAIQPKEGHLLAFNDYRKVHVWWARDFEPMVGPKALAGQEWGTVPMPTKEDQAVLEVRFAPDGKTLTAVYETYIDPKNPVSGWTTPAVMVCAVKRVTLGTPPARETYVIECAPEGIRLKRSPGGGAAGRGCVAFTEPLPGGKDQRDRQVVAVVWSEQNSYPTNANLCWEFLNLATGKIQEVWWDLSSPDSFVRQAWGQLGIVYPTVYDLETVRFGGKQYWLAAIGTGSYYLSRKSSAVLHSVDVPGSAGVTFVWKEPEGKAIRDPDGLMWRRNDRPVASCRHEGAVVALAVAPNDAWFATAEFCTKWHEKPPEAFFKRPIRPGALPILVSINQPSRIYIWDIAGRKLAVGEGHTMGVTDVAVSPDGKRIASCGVDGTLRIWEMPALR